MRVALIGCGKTKAAEPCKARDLYQGCLFKATLEYAEREFEKVYVLSALHELLLLDQIVAPYDRTLETMSDKEINGWGERIANRLIARQQQHDVTILAGKDYADPVAMWLRLYGNDVKLPLHGLTQGRRLGWFKSQREAGAA